MKRLGANDRRVWFWGALIIATMSIAFGVVYFWPYDPRSYHGDGEIDDTGFWSYPRYHIHFPDIPLHQPGEYTITCRGLPPEELTFVLAVGAHHDYETLTQLTTKLELIWRDFDGTELCRASGPLKDWVLTWGGQSNGHFWQPSCRDVRVSTRNSYHLKLSVKDIDPKSPPIEARPMLQGGGNELP